MTKNALAKVQSMDPEKAMARAAELLELWDIPEGGGRDLQAMVSAARAALQSGEARQIAEAITAPVPADDLGLTVAQIIASFPPRAGQDLQIFSKMMALDVIAAAPSRAALAGAARHLRATCTFLPSIKEVLDAVEEQKSACAARAALLERLPRKIAELDRQNNFATDGK